TTLVDPAPARHRIHQPRSRAGRQTVRDSAGGVERLFREDSGEHGAELRRRAPPQDSLRMVHVPSVAIAGAGIGGVPLAIALRRRSVPVTVFERATEIRPAGAGLGLASNAIVALERVGVGDRVVKASAPVRSVALLDTRGRRLGAELDVA